MECYNCFLLRSSRVILTDKLLSGEYISHLYDSGSLSEQILIHGDDSG